MSAAVLPGPEASRGAGRRFNLRQPAVREWLLLLGAFVLTRAALFAAGLRFNLDLEWMFLSDPADLQQHPLRSVFYFHAFAPGMDLLTGALLSLAPRHLASLASVVFWGSGVLFLLSATQVFRVLGCSSWVARGLALALSLLPQSLYFENLYLYTYPCAALLCCAALRFQRALLARSALSWFWFFLPCAVLGWFYTTFHLFWLLLCLALACFLAKGARLRVLRGALLPAALLAAVYVKNYAVFGVFGATSWGGGNLALATTQQMDPVLRSQWVAEGKLSPYAEISVFAPPATYLKFFPSEPHFPWPGTNELTRKSVNSSNFNHGLFLDINRRRGKDAVYFITHRPGDYLRLVLRRNLAKFFSSTTHWHPYDDTRASPHYGHRQVLGSYERLYDGLVHSWPVKGYGLYVFLPIFFVSALVRGARDLSKAEPERRAVGALIAFCALQILFITSVSSLFSAFEMSRYRYTVEPDIWFIVTSVLVAAYPRVRRWLSTLRGSSAEQRR